MRFGKGFVFILLSLLCSFSANADISEYPERIECHDSYDSFTIRKLNRSGDIYDLVCYQLKDITSWAADDGMRITTYVIPDAEKLVVIFTLEEDKPKNNEPKSSIRVIYIDEDGAMVKKDIITQRHTKDPKMTLSNMKIIDYEHYNKMVYFEVPAGNENNAIYTFPIPPDNNYDNVREKYITDGSLTFIDVTHFSHNNNLDGNIVVKRGVIKEDGKLSYGEYLVSLKGKTICELDTDVEGWKVYKQCKN
ncbi:hypothetical protein Ppb6_02010 [Photorhabdus australis subsp. thailandensis]|uniref:Uncharacterized protein n=1 Tax=Photorhabdus australis subsp. thailandensis TaxID=2805096 RepID=A0A1C0U414_9GAMM|nr:hypothetical protein [Photorhabdus australis]OCQ52667.1 hypothetical protein Ppb6_02010 [Photorhabdus australis subsp. thailandensis]